MKTINIVGMLVGVTAMALGLIWFSWKLDVVILLAIYGNNLEKKGRN